LRRKVRWQQLPPPVEDRTLDYAACRPELKDIEPGETVLAVEALEGFEHVIRPVLADIDRRRRAPRPGESKRRGRAPSFHALDYWRLEMLRRVIPKQSTQDTRDWLTMDKAKRTRELLAFDQPRTHHGGKARKWMAGVPSDGWMSDFRTKWLPEEKLAKLFVELERWGLAEKLATLPGMREELRLLNADGSTLLTHGTPPKYEKRRRDKNGNRPPPKVTNTDSITAPEAGFVSPGGTSSPSHSGSGWNIVFAMTSKGTVLAHRNIPLHESEPGALADMSDEPRETFDLLDAEPELRVLNADAAFHAQPTRKALREAGIIENIHLSKHLPKGRTVKSAVERDERTIAIEGHEWHTNGHRELACNCGKGKTSRHVNLDRKGKAIVRVKGECKTCGSVTLTSGWWRLANNGEKWVKCLSGDRHMAAWELGNPLTYNDMQAGSYGQPRYPLQEGQFGSQFSTRYKLLRGKRWFYRQSQVDLEVAAVITITHALSLERHRRMQTAAEDSVTSIRAGTGPPPLALAA
jgi:hypothetical protein